MQDAITDVNGIEVGHAHDAVRLTGCTVVMCRQGATAGVDVRGSAPGTRETDLCRPGTLVNQAHAIVLAGGSAFGLEAASGVTRWLWERGIGFAAGVTNVPVVPAAVLFDLEIGEVSWPDGDMGYQACELARGGAVPEGCVGAGMGATVGKLFGMPSATKCGVGTASMKIGDRTVGAIVAVNAFGDVVLPGSDRVIAGARNVPGGGFVDTASYLRQGGPVGDWPASDTTIGVVATDASLSSEAVNHLAAIAHDGLARTIRPVHTMVDGDTIFVLATGSGPAIAPSELIALASGVADITARAVIRAARAATPAGGLPAADAGY